MGLSIGYLTCEADEKLEQLVGGSAGQVASVLLILTSSSAAFPSIYFSSEPSNIPHLSNPHLLCLHAPSDPVPPRARHREDHHLLPDLQVWG